MLPYFFIEDHETDGVVLVRSQIGQRRREKLRILKFIDGSRPVAHGCAGVEEYHEMRIGLAEKSLDIGTFRASVDIPVDEARIITLSISAIFRELLAEAEERGTM